MKTSKHESAVVAGINSSVDELLLNEPVRITESVGALRRQSIGLIDRRSVRKLSEGETYVLGEGEQKESDFGEYSALYDAPALFLGESTEGDRLALRVRNDGQIALEQHADDEDAQHNQEAFQLEPQCSHLGLLVTSAAQILQINSFLDSAKNPSRDLLATATGYQKLHNELTQPGYHTETSLVEIENTQRDTTEDVRALNARLGALISTYGGRHAEQSIEIRGRDTNVRIWRSLLTARALSSDRLIILPIQPSVTVDCWVNIRPSETEKFDEVIYSARLDADKPSCYSDELRYDTKKLDNRRQALRDQWYEENCELIAWSHFTEDLRAASRHAHEIHETSALNSIYRWRHGGQQPNIRGLWEVLSILDGVSQE
ncbi:MAG: hypothetical protein AAB436_04635 [Patescibacteria group bacterium]